MVLEPVILHKILFDVIIKIPLKMAIKSNAKSGYIIGGQYNHTETNTEKKAKAI